MKFRLPSLAFLLACATTHSFGQYKVAVINQQGASLPCVGIGPAASLARKCVEMFQQAGFLRTDEVGYSGLTIGTSGKDDGEILAVQPDSPAAHAGLAVGDQITAVGDKPVKPTPGTIAAKAVFGPRGEALNLKVLRNGAEMNVSLVRAPQNAPAGPKSPSMFIMVRPLINWRGQFVPCMGAGLPGPAAIEYCDNHFKPYGFIKTGQVGSAGFQLDLEREDKATISAVEPDSVAAKAGIQPGDEIASVDDHPLVANVGEAATERLFGKVGDSFRVTVQQGQGTKTVALQLVARPKN